MLIISVKDVSVQSRHVHAHSLLKSCLRLHGIAYETDCGLVRNKYGKPSLETGCGVHFSLTHAEGIAACVTSPFECGIDAEPVKKYRPNVVRRAFSRSEQEQLEALDSEDERILLFTRLWTLKEAYVKALGIGISYPLAEAEFDLSDGSIRTPIQDFTFRNYLVCGERFSVSVCYSNKK
ncbi:MAG: 4'-phosphopantetheinyl transferase family protein [Ruminococcus sp.]